MKHSNYLCLSAVKHVKLNKQGKSTPKIYQEILQLMEKTAGYCKPAGYVANNKNNFT